MAKIVLEEQLEYPTLPDDSILFLKVNEVGTREVQGRNDNSWTKLEFQFKILGIQVTGDGSPLDRYDNLIGENIWGSVPFRLTDSPENKLRIWSEALLDMDLGVGFELDTEYFRGRECRGITSSYEKRTATGTKRRHQVETLLRKGGMAPPQQGPTGWGAVPQSQPQSFTAAPAAAPQAQPQLAQQPQLVTQDPWATTQFTEDPPF